MTKSDRLVIVGMFVMLFIVMVLQAGIYWNTRPPEEYEVITVSGTVNTTALEEAGYTIEIEGDSATWIIETEGYIKVVEEDTGFYPTGRCEICEAIQSGNITPTSWEDWVSDNFTIYVDGRPSLEKSDNITLGVEGYIIPYKDKRFTPSVFFID